MNWFHRLSSRRNSLLVIIIFIVAALLAGCGSSASQPGDAAKSAAEKKKKIAVGTATPAGGWFSIGGAMANAVSKHSRFEMTAEVSAAAVENFRNLDAGNLELAMSQPDTAWFYYTGTGDYAGKPHPDLRALWSMFISVNHTIVPGDSAIQSLPDLKGKKVAVGGPGSGNEMFVRILLQSHGITYNDIKPQYISSAQMMTALKDGQIDAIKPTLNVPNSAIADLAMTTDIKFVGIKPQDMEKFLKDNRGYFAYTLKANTYKGQTQAVLEPAFRGIVFTKEKTLTEDEIYELVKALWENRDEWKTVHVQTGEITLDQEFQGWPIPLHPGAYRYYKEKGLKIPEHLIPPGKKQ